MNIKQVSVNGIIVGTDLENKTAYETIYNVALSNSIHSFDVYVDGEELSEDEVRDLGTDWYEIIIETSEKPSWA